MTIAKMGKDQKIEADLDAFKRVMTPSERIRYGHAMAHGTVLTKTSVDPKTGDLHEEIIDPLDVYERGAQEVEEAYANAQFADYMRRQEERDLFEHNPKLDVLMGAIFATVAIGLATYFGLKWWFG